MAIVRNLCVCVCVCVWGGGGGGGRGRQGGGAPPARGVLGHAPSEIFEM